MNMKKIIAIIGILATILTSCYMGLTKFVKETHIELEKAEIEKK